MKIEVTAAHIEQGIAFSCENCPVALALREATGDRWSADTAVLIRDDGAMNVTPDAVARFIGDFDHFHTVEPFSFNLEIPCTQ